MGIKSRVTVCMERYGLSHDQAIEHIKQVTEDEAEAQEKGPAKAEPVAGPPVEDDDVSGAAGRRKRVDDRVPSRDRTRAAKRAIDMSDRDWPEDEISWSTGPGETSTSATRTARCAEHAMSYVPGGQAGRC